MRQRDLFDRTIQERFAEFHARHPDVYELFRHLAEGLIAKGRKRYSADAIMHRIRWHYDTTSQGESPKINDHFSSRYARMLAAQDERFANFFETRVLKTA